MKKKILLSAIMVLVICVVMGGASLALFIDSSSNANNTFTAGTVDIDSYRDGMDTIPGPMFYTTPSEGATPTNPPFDGQKPTGLWAPGDTHIRSLIVYNNGSLDAVLKQVKAEVKLDTKNMASQMNIAVYKILPKYLADGAPFAAIPGDDTLDQDELDRASNALNPFILMMNAFGVEDLTQELIEQDIEVSADKLWSGKLSDITAGYQDFNNPITLKSKSAFPFAKRGSLLAFVVQLDRNAGDNYQGAEANFAFTVNATQK